MARVEDVYLVAGPLTDRKYDAKKEKDLQNAIKREKLEELEKARLTQDGNKRKVSRCVHSL